MSSCFLADTGMYCSEADDCASRQGTRNSKPATLMPGAVAGGFRVRDVSDGQMRDACYTRKIGSCWWVDCHYISTSIVGYRAR